MQPAQQLLFPDPQPLVERLGRAFFRQLPESPGVYLMRDAAGAVLYVGKAKSLRKRLSSYRVANPERMARRHLRLLRAVARIDLEISADEQAALSREAELLLTLRPKFNRIGTWRGPSRFLACRREGESIFLRIVESEEAGWRMCGPLGGAALIRAAVVRLLWFGVYPRLGIARMPAGWVHGRLSDETAIRCGTRIEAAEAAVLQLLSSQAEKFCDWVRATLPSSIHAFDKAALEADLEFIVNSFQARTRRQSY